MRQIGLILYIVVVFAALAYMAHVAPDRLIRPDCNKIVGCMKSSHL